MNTLTDHDDLFKTLLMENMSPKCENESNFKTVYGINKFEISNILQLETSIEGGSVQEKYQNENDFMEFSVEDYDSVLNFNKQIISSLLDLKRHITFALQKCEKKLTVIETSLQKHTIEDTKAAICNAGIPYFKDRDYFFAPSNEDEILKENNKELQLRNLPKVSPWTIKERSILLEAIKEEAITHALCPQKIDSMTVKDTKVKSNDEDKERTHKIFPPTDFLEMIGPLEGTEFDWFKISSLHFDNIHSPLDCHVMWSVFLHPDINKNVWTKSEDIKLKEIAKKHKFQNWDKIAKDLNTNRTAYQCFIRYNTSKKLTKAQNYTWKPEEDERLLKLVEILRIGDFIPWGEVANWMQNRTKQQAYFRWVYSLAPYLTKGRFTKAEDRILKDAVNKYGTNFRKISAALMPNRSTVQLHDRYETLTANQTANQKVWTFTEDSKLLDLFVRFGPNWSRIAKAFSRKTRTQLRHRHRALQKYIQRGISLHDLHSNQFFVVNKTKRKQRKTMTHKDTFDYNVNLFSENDNYDIDTELIYYFYTEQRTKRLIYKNELYTAEELSHNTRNLYNILRQLNAKLYIPDNITNIKLSGRDQQLLYSLKEYEKLKKDKGRHFEIIDKYSLRMFGPDYNKKEDSYYIPPLPFDLQVKLKKSVQSKCIDYNLNTNNNFLLEKPVEIDTPDFVISHIGGHEQQLQFHKFEQSFQLSNANSKCTYLQNIPKRLTKMFFQQNNNSTSRNDLSGDKLTKIKGVDCSDHIIGTPFESNAVHSCEHVKLQNEHYMNSCTQSIKKNYLLFNMPEEIRSSAISETEVTTKKDVPVIEATHSTLLSLKNLKYLKQLDKKCIRSNQYFQEQQYKFQEALKLLETRLEQLFQYPIGLSHTALPEVYVIDIMEDIALKKDLKH